MSEMVQRAPKRYAYESAAASLRLNEGTPTVIRAYPVSERNSAAQLRLSIRSGRYRAFQPPGAFDAFTRTEPAGDGAVVNVYAWFGELAEDGRCPGLRLPAGLRRPPEQRPWLTAT